MSSRSTSVIPRQFEEKEWDITVPTDLNIQKNSYDRGAYVCMYSFMVCNGCFFDCNDLNSKLERNWIATNIISEPDEKSKHKKFDFKQRDSSFPTKKWSENFVVYRKSPREFTSGVGNLFSRRAALITKELAKGQCSCKCPKKRSTFLHCRITERGHDGLQKKKVITL